MRLIANTDIYYIYVSTKFVVQMLNIYEPVESLVKETFFLKYVLNVHTPHCSFHVSCIYLHHLNTLGPKQTASAYCS